MKRFYLFGAVTLASVSMLLTSCGNSEPKPLSTKDIVKEVNQKLVDDAKAELFTEVAVGTYECNDPMSRQFLAKLEVAGLIEYDVTRYAWWEKSKKSYKKAYTVTRGYGWWSYQDIEMGCSKSSPKKEVYSNTILPQEIRKTSNRQHNFTPKTAGKRRTKQKTPKLVEGKKS